MDIEALRNLLDAVAQGSLNPEQALTQLKHLDTETVGDFARVDHHRALRTGFPEVIWGQDKTPDQIVQIMQSLRKHNRVVMATRIDPDIYAQIRARLSDVKYFPTAKICAVIESPKLKIPQQDSFNYSISRYSDPTPRSFVQVRYGGTIAILTAGTADLPVAEEAAVTAELSGFQVDRLWDVGVSGIHRLLNNRDVIEAANVLIVVAGMEGALPSVVAGLADCPVIAVPTSIGYGASFGGLAPLLTMLNSCAAGVGVVNIDNGFGAAMLAGQILRTAARLKQNLGDEIS